MTVEHDEILPEHRISNLKAGQYNSCVNLCIKCGEHLQVNTENYLGFCSDPPHRSELIANDVSVIYECPVCFTVQWCHGNMSTYRAFLRLLSEQKKGILV